MEKLEQVWNKEHRKARSQERDCKQHKGKDVKRHKAVNGKEHNEDSGTMTFYYKKLHISKELVKKAKKLVETTTGLNNTFIQFIQQATKEQGDNSIRYRHLNAFKSVLADLKKAHTALEDVLEPEFKSMELQNGDEVSHVSHRKGVDEVAPAANDLMDDAAAEPDEERDQDEEEEEEEEEDEEEEEEEEEDGGSGGDRSQSEPELKEAEKRTGEAKVAAGKTENCDDDNDDDEDNDEDDDDDDDDDDDSMPVDEMSLDHDIVSVPPSVPEELFQMVESLADTSMLSQTADGDAADDVDADDAAGAGKETAANSQRHQPKVKNLIVKLTPVPVVRTCSSRSSRSSRSKNKNKDTEVKTLKKKEGKKKKGAEEVEEENDANDNVEDDHVEDEVEQEEEAQEVDEVEKAADAEEVDEKEAAKDSGAEEKPRNGTARDGVPSKRRSSRVKTTPLRKQAENKAKEDSSEADEPNRDSKAGKSGGKTKDGKRTKTSPPANEDSDSDEVPDILLQTAAEQEQHGSAGEEGEKSAKKCLFKQDKKETPSKRKRKSDSSDSDFQDEGKKKTSVASKKKQKKQQHSGSESSDSDNGKDLGKLSVQKRRSSRTKKKEGDAKESPDVKAGNRKRSYEMKRKARKAKGASKQTSSSDEEEDGEERAVDGEDSAEDSDQQKIKPLVEENVATASKNFRQSSGDDDHHNNHGGHRQHVPVNTLLIAA